jgi:hypothetical protein
VATSIGSLWVLHAALAWWVGGGRSRFDLDCELARRTVAVGVRCYAHCALGFTGGERYHRARGDYSSFAYIEGLVELHCVAARFLFI